MTDLDRVETRAIVRRSESEEQIFSLPRDHSGNAETVQLLTGDSIRYNEHRNWYVWNGAYWQDDEQLVKRTVAEVLRKRRNLYGAGETPPMTLQSNRENVSGTMWMLQAIANVDLKFFDSEDDLLPAPNGVINLRNGMLRAHDKNYGFTFNTTVEYNHNADYSEWEAYLRESLQAGEDELLALKIWAGYMLTGRTDDERIMYLYGPTGSGKGTFVDTMTSLLPHPVAQVRGFGSFAAKRENDTQYFDFAGLERARMLHAHESSRFLELNAPMLKTLTSDDLFATYKGKQGFNFHPKFKLILTSNWAPNIDPDDDAAWSRVYLVHFPVAHRDTVDEDTSLKARFQQTEQLQGVLKWAVEGAQEWYKRSATGKVGLLIPQSSKELKQSKRNELDKVKEWLEENTEVRVGACAPSAELSANYEAWCKANSVEPKRAKSFATAMDNKGFPPGKCSNSDGVRVRGYSNLVLTTKYIKDYDGNMLRTKRTE